MAFSVNVNFNLNHLLPFIIEHDNVNQIGYAHINKMFDKVRIGCYI